MCLKVSSFFRRHCLWMLKCVLCCRSEGALEDTGQTWTQRGKHRPQFWRLRRLRSLRRLETWTQESNETQDLGRHRPMNECVRRARSGVEHSGAERNAALRAGALHVHHVHTQALFTQVVCRCCPLCVVARSWCLLVGTLSGLLALPSAGGSAALLCGHMFLPFLGLHSVVGCVAL